MQERRTRNDHINKKCSKTKRKIEPRTFCFFTSMFHKYRHGAERIKKRQSRVGGGEWAKSEKNSMTGITESGIREGVVAVGITDERLALPRRTLSMEARNFIAMSWNMITLLMLSYRRESATASTTLRCFRPAWAVWAVSTSYYFPWLLILEFRPARDYDIIDMINPTISTIYDAPENYIFVSRKFLFFPYKRVVKWLIS